MMGNVIAAHDRRRFEVYGCRLAVPADIEAFDLWRLIFSDPPEGRMPTPTGGSPG